MAAGSGGAEFELSSLPTDGITAVKFSKSANILLCSSWDSTLRLYDVNMNSMRSCFDHDSPVLDCCFSDNAHSFAGLLDGSIKMHGFADGSTIHLGSHSDGVKCLEYSPLTNQLVSGSWDRALKIWDPRISSEVATYDLPGKVYTMALAGNRVIIGMSRRAINVFDLRRMDRPEQERESPLKKQTRCIRIFTDHSGFAVSSIEGRVAMEYFDLSEEVQSKKFAFKCHRHVEDGVETVYPVNAIAFHPIYGTFATGGCDGTVHIWDGQVRKRVSQLPRYASSIASLSFSHDGSMLAIASSYTFEEGERDNPNDQVIIRVITDNEVKPRVKTMK